MPQAAGNRSVAASSLQPQALLGSFPLDVLRGWRGRPVPFRRGRRDREKVHGLPPVVDMLLGAPPWAREKTGCSPTTNLRSLVAEMEAFDSEVARIEAILRMEGFHVVGSMENLHTKSSAVGATEGSD